MSIISQTSWAIFKVSAEDTKTEYKAGDVIEFGSYQQGAIKNENNETTGFKTEPIQWRILKIENGKALLLSSKILDAGMYNSTSATVGGYYANNYARSDIREWLINDFYNNAFSLAEKQCIVATTLDNSACETSYNASGHYSKYSSESTTDKVFLLSKSEADTYASKYFSSVPTDYAYSNGFKPGQSNPPSNHWYLRTAGNNTFQIYYVQIRFGVYKTYFNWHDDALQANMGVRPAIYLDLAKFQAQQNVGILQDYEISINLDTGVNWISNVTIDGVQYPVKQELLNLEKVKELENKKVYFSCTDGVVDLICALDDVTIPNVSLYDQLTLTYKKGKFSPKNKEIKGSVSNYTRIGINNELTEAIDELSLTDVTIELKSSNKDIIYFKESWYRREEKQSITFSVDDVRAGKSEDFPIKIYVNNQYEFPQNLQNDSVTIVCTMTARKNGQIVTDTFDYKVALINDDYKIHNDPEIKKTWKTQSITDLIEQLYGVVENCSRLDEEEKEELRWDIRRYLAMYGLSKLPQLEAEYEILNFVYDMDCYFYGRKYATVGTAGEKLLEAIIDECETESEEIKKELEKDLRAELESLFKDDNFNILINWYYDQYENGVGNNKAVELKNLSKSNTNKRTYSTRAETHDNDESSETENAKQTEIMNPVDITITDEDGCTVLSVVNNEVVFISEDISVYMHDGNIILYLPTDIDHNIQIIATDDGTMDYSITEYSSTGEERVTTYTNIPLVKDKVCSGNITMESMPDESVYQLTEMTLDKPAVAGVSVKLQDKFSLSLKVDDNMFKEIGYTKPFALFEMNGETVLVDDFQIADGQYEFDFHDISPVNMNDIIKATLYVTYDGFTYQSETTEYSVVEYCREILADDSYSEYHALVKEMLNYGAMAQVYFDYDAQNLANDGIADVAATDVPETAEELIVADNLSGLNFYGASLVYRDRIAVRYYFTGDVTELTFTANGNTYLPVAKDGMHYIEIADILPQDLDQQITLTVSDKDGNTLTVTYGPMNYIVRMYAKDDANLQNLMKALYNYHLAAKNFKNNSYHVPDLLPEDEF